MPAANAWGCETSAASSKYVKLVETDAVGAVRVTAQAIDAAQIDNKYVTLVPVASGNATIDATHPLFGWVCGNTTAIAGTNFVTTIASKFLPGSCRGT
jgi:type IV pilus assembly protein PilA